MVRGSAIASARQAVKTGWRNKPPLGGWPRLPNAWAADWDVKDGVQDRSNADSLDAKDLLAGGGYQV